MTSTAVPSKRRGKNPGKKSTEARKQAEKRVEIEKKIFHFQELLIENSSVSELALKDAALLFQPRQYLDVVSERAIDLCCGYPNCGNRIVKTKGQAPKYKLSLETKRVFDNSELSLYCSSECMIASKLYVSQLLEIPAYLRTSEDLKSLEFIKFAHDVTDSLNENINSSLLLATVGDVKSLILPYGSPVDLEKIQANLEVQERDTAQSIPIATVPTPSALLSPPESVKTSAITNTEQTPLVQNLSNLKVKTQQKQKKVQFTNKHNQIVESNSEDSDNAFYGLQNSSDEELTIAMTPFGLLWTTLENWKTPETLRFLQARNPLKGENNSSVMEHIFLPNHSQTALRRQSLLASLSPHFAGLRAALQLEYTIDQDVIQLVSTFYLEHALPSFSVQQWKTVALLVTELLSYQNIELKKQLQGFLSNKISVLAKCKINSDEYSVLLGVFVV